MKLISNFQLVASFFLSFFLLSLMITNAQSDVCVTSGDFPNIDYYESNYSFDPSPICVNVHFHIIRQDNGTGGYNVNNLESIIQDLNDAYSPHNIIFDFDRINGYDYINNSSFANYNIYSDITFYNLVSINKQSDALNIYLSANNYGAAGRANAIPGDAVVVSNQFINTSTMAHEVGHALNLFHTHRGILCNNYLDPNSCLELINGDIQNRKNCGDYVADTPPDPCLFNEVDDECEYEGAASQNGISYNPLTDNIMSYSDKPCRDKFTTGQGVRMRQALLNNPTLQNFISTGCYDILGDDLICTSKTYSISNFPSGATVSWSALPSTYVTFNNTTIQNPTVTLVNQNYSGSVTLVATINDNGSIFSINKVIQYGKPYFQYQLDTPLYPEAVVYNPSLENCNFSCYDRTTWLHYSTSIAVNATSENWQKLYSLPSHINFWSANNNQVNVLYKAGFQTYHLKRTASNSCGSVEEEYQFCSTGTNCNSGFRMPIKDNLKFEIYPNPISANQKLMIKHVSNAKTFSKHNRLIEIYDFQGQLLLTSLHSFKDSQKVEISISKLPSGIYFLKIDHEVAKFIIN